METQEFTDVTLISDDYHQYKVHKFILSACSTAFRKILMNNPLNSSIYLRGIYHEELESILQFMYLGKATIHHERLNEFLNVAKSLVINEIEKTYVSEDGESEGVNDNKSKDHEDLIQASGNQINNETISGKIIQDINEFQSVSKWPIKNEIEKTFMDEDEEKDVMNDNKSKDHNNPIRSSENQINYETVSSIPIIQDIKSKSSNFIILDDEKPYKCQQCDYQTKQKSHVQLHINSKHKGILYPCQQCDLQVASPNSLLRHIKSKHEGFKYPCQQCDYQATTSSNLQLHIRSKQCDYHGNYQSTLNGHKKSNH